MTETPTGPMDAKRLQDILLISPFHRWLRLRIVSQANDSLELEMPWRDEIVSNPAIGAAHGGILSALIDLTGLYAVLSAGGVAKATADLRVDFHRAATEGPLRAIGHPIKMGRTLCIADTQILSADGRLLASGRGAYVSG